MQWDKVKTAMIWMVLVVLFGLVIWVLSGAHMSAVESVYFTK